MQGCRNAEALRKAKRTAAAHRAELGRIHEVRPKCSRKAAQGSRRWYELQNQAFARAFVDSGETWPTEAN